jgi:small subunit ribosomal protein S6
VVALDIRNDEVLRSSEMSDRQYELVYILPPDTTEQQVTELHEQLEAVVSRMHGQIEKTENWGRRRLAYEIAHQKEGVYVLEVINGSGELMKELDRRLRVMDQVVRHLVVRVDHEKKVVERTRTKRQSNSERRRVKRGLPPQRQPGEGRPAGEVEEAEDDRFDGVEV